MSDVSTKNIIDYKFLMCSDVVVVAGPESRVGACLNLNESEHAHGTYVPIRFYRCALEKSKLLLFGKL